MNIWNQEYAHWSGPWFDENLPLKAYYDYVSYASYTPDSGNCGTNNNFTLQWKDDFDEWDQSRWEKATHTFPGNLCDFVPENVIFEDGYMILCLTDEEHVGGRMCNHLPCFGSGPLKMKSLPNLMKSWIPCRQPILPILPFPAARS